LYFLKINFSQLKKLFLLEEMRDRKYNDYAVILQKAFRKFNATQYFLKLKNEAADLMYQKKERRALSVNRKFYGDYIGLDQKPSLRMLINKRETIEFAQTCFKYDRQFKKQKRDFILTNKALYIIGREEKKDSQTKRKCIIEVIKRRIEFSDINKILLSHLQDNFLVVFSLNEEYGSVLEIEFKTEFLTTLSKRYKELGLNKQLSIQFMDA